MNEKNQQIKCKISLNLAFCMVWMIENTCCVVSKPPGWSGDGSQATAFQFLHLNGSAYINSYDMSWICRKGYHLSIFIFETPLLGS